MEEIMDINFSRRFPFLWTYDRLMCWWVPAPPQTPIIDDILLYLHILMCSRAQSWNTVEINTHQKPRNPGDKAGDVGYAAGFGPRSTFSPQKLHIN